MCHAKFLFHASYPWPSQYEGCCKNHGSRTKDKEAGGMFFLAGKSQAIWPLNSRKGLCPWAGSGRIRVVGDDCGWIWVVEGGCGALAVSGSNHSPAPTQWQKPDTHVSKPILSLDLIPRSGFHFPHYPLPPSLRVLSTPFPFLFLFPRHFLSAWPSSETNSSIDGNC